MSNGNTPAIVVDGTMYNVNIEELTSFMQHCKKFMNTNGSDWETMAQIIADSVLESADSDATIDEIRPQLLFLREVSMLLKGIITPAIGLPVQSVTELQ